MNKLYTTIIVFIFITNLLPAQTPQWQWVKGGGSEGSPTNSNLKESCQWLGTDAHGNIYGMSSIFDFGIQIDTSILANGFGFDDFAVFSYRCDGSLRWVRYFGSNYNDSPKGMFTDPDGNTYVTGAVPVYYTGDAHFGDSTIPATTTMAKSCFVAKLDSTGHTHWISLPGPDFITSETYYDFYALQPDNQGNVCALTYFCGAIALGTFNVPNKGYYVVKFDKSNGNIIGLTKLDYRGSISQSPIYIKFIIDSDNSYYLRDNVGSHDTLFVGTNIITCENDSIQAFTVTKLFPSGNVSWYKYTKSNGFACQNKIINSILVNDNYVYILGQANNNVNVLGGIINNPYISYSYIEVPFIARLRKDNGNFVSLKHVYNQEIALFTQAASTSNGIVVSGAMGANSITNGRFMYNQGDTLKPFATMNTAYPFILEIDTNLTHFNWGIATRVNDPISRIEALAVDASGNIYAGGHIADSIYPGSGAGIQSHGGPTDFFIAKISANNNCGCELAIPNPQLVGINNYTLTVKGTATGQADSLFWYWGDGTTNSYVAQNTNISHIYSTGGNYTVCLKTYNACGSKDSCLSIIGVGINEVELKYINTFPNPVTNILTIENPYQCSMQVTIYNIIGKIQHSNTYENYTTNIDMSNFQKGIYILGITLPDGRKAVRKVTKE